MTDIEYLLTGIGIGIAMRFLIAMLDSLISLFNKVKK